jgi:hypothetical protein
MWFWKSNGNVFWKKHMVNIDELNGFVEWFEYGFQRLILILRLLMKSIIHYYFTLQWLSLQSWKHIMILELVWKVIIHHENILWILSPVTHRDLLRFLSHTILFIYFWVETLEDDWRILLCLVYFFVILWMSVFALHLGSISYGD